MDLKTATSLLDAAVAKSSSMSKAMNIAVCDAGGHLIAFRRMDGAWLGSIDIAIKKAKTSALFGGLDTMTFGELVRQMNLQGIEQTTGGLVTFGGGVSVSSGGKIVGAIGVSG